MRRTARALAGLLVAMGGLTTVGCGGGGDGKDDVASDSFGGVVNPPEPGDPVAPAPAAPPGRAAW